jgi:signal transduction histidine kinase
MQAIASNEELGPRSSPVAAGHNARSRRIAWFMCGFVLLLVLPIAVLALLNRNSADVWKISDPYLGLGALVYASVGALIATRQPRNSLGWLFLVMGFFGQIGSLCAAWAVYSLETAPGTSGGAWALWLNTWISVSAFMPMFPLLLFPNGKLEDRKARVVAGLTLLSTLWLLFCLVSGTTIPPGFPEVYSRTPNPLFPGQPLGDAGIGIMALGICGLLAVGLVLMRFRRSTGILRQQYMWIVLDMCLLALTFVADFVARGVVGRGYEITTPLMNLSIALLPVAVGIAILRYHLFDIEFIFSRAIVYILLSACVVGIYVLVVGWLGTLFRTGGNLAFSLVATGIVAVLFHPMRELFQRRVNRVLFGERDEPYAAISRLGQRLESTLAVDAILPAIAGTVREALKLPYVAVSVAQGLGPALSVESGNPVTNPLRLPLLYQHEHVGEILLAPRTPGEPFGPADRRLLDDLARQAGIAVHAVRLTRELQQARERLVETREEERRRLHRDLHDGLGSQLAALNLQLGAIPTLIAQNPSAAQEEVAELRAQLKAAISSIRALVQGLRPPAIDELGLPVSLRERIRQYNTDDFMVRTSIPDRLPELPAAVEVAIYRIVEEALTNVTKHSQAHWCLVYLTIVDSTLVLEVQDDGLGIESGSVPGVGLHSMRERAEELGGKFSVVSRAGGGTVVRASFRLDRLENEGA